MRTKTLLLAAALGAAGIATSMAQTVYSVNAVGYVNVNLPAGYSMISNPLNGTNNNISTILPSVPDGSVLYKFNSASQGYFDAVTFLGGWDSDPTLAPGDGAFIFVEAPTTVTFVGEVPQGNLSNPLAQNYSIASSQVPQSGALTAVLGYPANDGDVVYLFDRGAQSFSQPYTFLGGWDPVDPVIGVAESFFVFRDVAGSWTRTFNVNTP